MKRGNRFSFHVTVVIAAIAFIYFSTVFVFIDQWFGLWSSPGMLNAVFFTVVAAMCISNYALAIYTDPGHVPSSFVPDIEDPEHIVHEIKRKVFFISFSFIFIFCLDLLAFIFQSCHFLNSHLILYILVLITSICISVQ